MSTPAPAPTPTIPSPSAGRTGATARWVRLGVVLVVQLLLVAVAVANPLRARLTGTEYRMAVTLYDPVDPFRGAYVSLGYPSLNAAAEALPEERRHALSDHDVYVPLARQGQLWGAREILADRPTEGPYLACRLAYVTATCGIESWFLPEGSASQMGRDLAESKVVAVVKVDSSGHAALVGLTR